MEDEVISREKPVHEHSVPSNSVLMARETAFSAGGVITALDHQKDLYNNSPLNNAYHSFLHNRFILEQPCSLEEVLLDSCKAWSAYRFESSYSPLANF